MQPFDPELDTDGDGLYDWEEVCVYGTNPFFYDTDGDGLPDGWEVMHGLNPHDPSDAHEDPDEDGLTNFEEYMYGTDPFNWDTDGDGVSDGDEVAQGSDPLDANDSEEPDPDDIVEVTLEVGDHSGSHSEFWALRFTRKDTGAVFLNFLAPGYGQVTDPTPIKFRRGRSYDIELIHHGSNCGVGEEDYDYTAHVTLPPEACGWVDDPQGLLGVVNVGGGCGSGVPSPNLATGKVATLHLPKATLDVARVQGNHPSPNVAGFLSDARKKNPGAFLPLNNDDDDYSATGPADDGADYQQSGAIDGENDLLPIVLRAIEPTDAEGEYTLTIPSHVRVWQAADRSGAVDGTTTFAADQETTLYVEGIAESVGHLQLNWSNNSGQCNNIDHALLTVFTWQGPLNVPGYSAYEYTVTGALPAWTGWETPAAGTITNGMWTQTATILWGSGPSVGRAVLEVNEDYLWELEVNVVQIEINLEPGSPTELDYNNPSAQNPPLGPRIVSSTSGPAMLATAAVSVEGPIVSGVMRGTRFIEMGFIQNANFVSKHADFDFENPPAPPPVPHRNRSSLEGTGWLLDYVTSPPSTAPWYDSVGSGFVAPGDLVGPTSYVLSITDTPMLLASDTMTLTLPGVPGAPDVADGVDRFAIVFDFNLYFAVRTTAAVNGSAVIYTQRGAANWTFNGSGSVTDPGKVWTSSVTPNNSGSTTFSPVNSGAVVPVTTGTPVNHLFPGETWTIVPQ